MKIKVHIQIATKHRPLPPKKELVTWARTAIKTKFDSAEITLRLIHEEESRALNEKYRGKFNPTNVLSFQYEKNLQEKHLSGDLALCACLIEKQSLEYNVPLFEHWAHLVVHGCLHLLDYTHTSKEEAFTMESAEGKILQELGYANPYI